MKVTEHLAKNQVVMEVGNATIFQSYDSVICKWKTGENPIFSEHWDYSRTTMKYLGKFLHMNSKEIRKKVKDGEFKVGIDTNGRNLC